MLGLGAAVTAVVLLIVRLTSDNTQRVAANPAPATPPAAVRADLIERARTLKVAGREVEASQLVCAETGMGIVDAQAFVRSLH